MTLYSADLIIPFYFSFGFVYFVFCANYIQLIQKKDNLEDTMFLMENNNYCNREELTIVKRDLRTVSIITMLMSAVFFIASIFYLADFIHSKNVK